MFFFFVIWFLFFVFKAKRLPTLSKLISNQSTTESTTGNQLVLSNDESLTKPSPSTTLTSHSRGATTTQDEAHV